MSRHSLTCVTTSVSGGARERGGGLFESNPFLVCGTSGSGLWLSWLPEECEVGEVSERGLN